MKDFVVKYYGFLFVILVIIVVLIAIFTWTLTQDKKFISEKYVQIATIFFGVSVALSMLSFYALHKGSSEKSVLSKEETEKIIVEAVNSSLETTLEEQEKGLGGIQTKVEVVNKLLGETEESLKRLDASAKKIEELSDFVAYKNSNNEISVFIRYRSVGPLSKKMSAEQIRELQIEKSKIYYSNVVFEIKIPSITAKYSASEVPYTRLNVSDDLFRLKRNSYSLGLGFQLGQVSTATKVNHRLVIQELSKKFNEIKVGDTLEIITNKGLIIDSADEKVIIELNDGMRFFCEFINKKEDNNIDSILIYYTLKITSIKF